MSLYAKGQLVWAKVKGYPWWPAVVAKTNQDRNGSIDKEILVNFVGDNSHAMLTHDKIADYTDKFKQHSANKNKKLQDSIRIARKILDGESTFEEEREKLIKEIARSQESPEQDEVKQTSRGRPSSKKKLEAASGAVNNAAVSGKDNTKENVKEKGKESTSKAKELSQKEKEKGVLYKFKEDVLGLQMNNDTNKASTTSMQDKENAPREKVSPKSQSQKQVKDSRLAQKQKVKEKEKEKKLSRETEEYQEYQDYLPFRLTRAQSKRDPSEGHTEPSTGPREQKEQKEQSSKGESSKAAAAKTGGSGSGQKQVKNNNSKETPSKPTKAKGRLLLDEDDLLDNYRNNSRKAAAAAVTVQPVVEEKAEEKMMVEEEAMMSPGKWSERKYSGPKSEIEDKKEDKKEVPKMTTLESPPVQNARKSSGSEKSEKMEKIEKTEKVEKVEKIEKIEKKEKVEKIEKMDVEVAAPKEVKALEVRKNSDELSNKRSNSNILKDSPPIYGAQVKNKEEKPAIRILEESDFITKKVKTGSSMINRGYEEEVLDEKELGTEVYNMLMIKKFEENLRKILDKLSTKLQGNERLKEYDADMIKMLGVIEDFENRTYSGSEFVGSDLGKILKTIHFLLIKNKHKLPKTGDLVITALAKIIHKIKDKILKFCLDNSDYMDALHLPQEKAKPVAITAIDIDFEEIRAKIEEGENDTKVETKVEEEHPAAHAQHAQKPVVVHHIIEAPAIVQQPQQPTAPVLTSYGQREVHNREHHHHNVKESPVIRPSASEPTEISLLLRKKICQKLAKLLQRSYNIDKDRSQKLTLHIEDKLNKFYLGNVNEYKHAIKGLHKLIKTQSLKFDDLTQILEMTIQQFRQMLREKLPEMADIYNDMSPPMATEEVEKRELPLLNEESATFDFDACLKAKLDSDMALNMAKKNEDDEIKPKMLVEQPNSFIQDLFQTKEEGL